MPLTQPQIDFFWQNGYVSIGKILADDDIATLRAEYDRIFDDANKTSKYQNLTVAWDADAATKKAAPKQMLQIMNVFERSTVFNRLIYDARILDLIQDLVGPNIMLFHDQALFKPARTGGPVYWHQDNAYWKCAPATLVSCWLTLDDVVKENGAMQVIPASHLTPVWHDTSASTSALKQTKIDETKAVVVDLPAGGCMFHHCQTLHYTQPNETDRQRRAFAIHFMQPGTRGGDGNFIGVDYHHPMLRMRV